MDDKEVLSRISTLVQEEDILHSRATDTGLSDEEHQRIRQIDEALDQCWDLLRQRRARRAAGQDPDEAQPRSAQVVENYRQ